MNVETGTVAVQFLFWEFLSRILVLALCNVCLKESAQCPARLIKAYPKDNLSGKNGIRLIIVFSDAQEQESEEVELVSAGGLLTSSAKFHKKSAKR
jgi:hypothetical protein